MIAWCKLWQIHRKFQWGLIIACKWVIRRNILMHCLHGCSNVENFTLNSNSMYGTFSDRGLWPRRSSIRENLPHSDLHSNWTKNVGFFSIKGSIHTSARKQKQKKSLKWFTAAYLVGSWFAFSREATDWMEEAKCGIRKASCCHNWVAAYSRFVWKLHWNEFIKGREDKCETKVR